jgi:ABC-2 type transport system permease protein
VLIFLGAALPVVIAALGAAFGSSDPDREEFTRFMLDGMLVAAILPIVTMALATATFGNDLEDKTLGYLVLKPISRWRIVAPKYLAVVLLAVPLIVLSGVLVTVIGPLEGALAALAVGAALLVGVLAYSAIFTWAGLMTTRALGFALVYVFLWEGLLSSFLGGIRYLSVRGYTLAVMHGIDKDSLEALDGFVIGLPAAIVGAAVVTVVFLSLTVRRLRTMDVP